MPICVRPTCFIPLCLMPLCGTPTWFMPLGVMPACVMPTCVTRTCFIPLYVMPLCVTPLCVMTIRRTSLLPFSFGMKHSFVIAMILFQLLSIEVCHRYTSILTSGDGIGPHFLWGIDECSEKKKQNKTKSFKYKVCVLCLCFLNRSFSQLLFHWMYSSYHNFFNWLISSWVSIYELPIMARLASSLRGTAIRYQMMANSVLLGPNVPRYEVLPVFGDFSSA